MKDRQEAWSSLFLIFWCIFFSHGFLWISIARHLSSFPNLTEGHRVTWGASQWNDGWHFCWVFHLYSGEVEELREPPGSWARGIIHGRRLRCVTAFQGKDCWMGRSQADHNLCTPQRFNFQSSSLVKQFYYHCDPRTVLILKDQGYNSIMLSILY